MGSDRLWLAIKRVVLSLAFLQLAVCTCFNYTLTKQMKNSVVMLERHYSNLMATLAAIKLAN